MISKASSGPPGKGPSTSHGPWCSRTGAAAPALLFWLLAILLFAVPFLRSPDAAEWDDPRDPRRRANWSDPNTPYSTVDLAFWEEVARADTEMADTFGGGLKAYIEESSEAWFGRGSEALRSNGVIEVSRLAAGRKTYNAECAGCHGGDLVAGVAPGNGAGPAARYMNPRPRNFRKGMFKFTSTATGERPLRSDMYRTIAKGLAGASMPHFKLLTEERRHDVVEYVRYISVRGEFEELLFSFSVEDEEFSDAEEVATLVYDRWDEENLTPVFPSSAEPEMTQASIDRGRDLYMDSGGAGCVGCHGPLGHGDGPSAEKFLDGWGYPIKPRDFTDGVYRAGDTNAALWVSIATGITGSPMGSFIDSLTSEEIWNVVHFIRSLEKPKGGN